MNESSITGRFPVKFAAFDQATIAEHVIVAAVTAKKIRVLSIYLACAGAQTVRFRSNAAGTVISGVMSFAANGGFSNSFDDGLFETAIGANLIMQLTAAVQTGGALSYVELD